ncbi:MAG: shikimate kinase [Peptostreptococcaceae bacterium]
MNIIIIGFMGVGKSVVGDKLARILNMQFIDMDTEIEKREKCTIPEIFKNKGQDYFRDAEKKLIKELVEKDNFVVSTGGGIVTQSENCKILKEQKHVVFLDADVNTIIEHVCNEMEKRPLLKESKNLQEKVNELMIERYSDYKESSNIMIDVNNKNINEVVSQILVYIREYMIL